MNFRESSVSCNHEYIYNYFNFGTFSFLVIVFLILKLLKKDKSDQINDKIKDDIESLKVSLNSQISGITGSFNNLSQGVTRDTTQTLSKVDEKLSNVYKIIDTLNKGQKIFQKFYLKIWNSSRIFFRSIS